MESPLVSRHCAHSGLTAAGHRGAGPAEVRPNEGALLALEAYRTQRTYEARNAVLSLLPASSTFA